MEENSEQIGKEFRKMNPLDRRRRKSQKAIMDAFIQLLSKKSLQEITLNEIAEGADVSRGTIYSNFLDKYDLLDKCIEANIENLFSTCLKNEENSLVLSKDVFVRSFDYLAQHANLYKILFKQSGENHFKEQLFAHSIKTLRREKTLPDVFLQFYSSAVIGVIIWWVLNDQPCSVEEVSESLWTLLADINNR